ncbi:hypothetical protein NL676_034089 [Syzygium grande]|nr:hypothetical protein NL676_034089 [Syzygium grande]
MRAPLSKNPSDPYKFPFPPPPNPPWVDRGDAREPTHRPSQVRSLPSPSRRFPVMSRSEIIVGVYGGRGWEEEDGGDDGDGSLRGRMVCKRRSSVSLPFSPLAMVGGRGGFSRKSFSYSQLPQEPLKLSVLKLDGSCFGNSLPLPPLPFRRGGGVFILRPRHVWGQFCLCYNGQKLVTETDYIIDYGIKDGDQLHFIRHVSGVPSSTRKKSSVWLAASDNPGGVVPYSRLAMIEDRNRGKVTSSKCVDAFWSRVRTLLVFCSGAPYSQKDSWRD